MRPEGEGALGAGGQRALAWAGGDGSSWRKRVEEAAISSREVKE